MYKASNVVTRSAKIFGEPRFLGQCLRKARKPMPDLVATELDVTRDASIRSLMTAAATSRGFTAPAAGRIAANACMTAMSGASFSDRSRRLVSLWRSLVAPQ
jgi:hypothetical protein